MTAPQGRCAGCTETGPVREVIAHIVSCDAFAERYQRGERPLEPAQEYARWLAEDRDGEHARDLAHRVDDTVRRRDRSADRFAGHDLLGDDDEYDRPVAGAVRAP
jgi:hypothetical protein